MSTTPERMARGRDPRVIVVGSVNIDMAVEVAALPKPGETVLGRDFRRSLGGKGANQATAASRLGATTAIIAAVGDDDEGREAVAFLNEEGIDTAGVTFSTGTRTGVALICVDRHAQNQIVVAQGANATLDGPMVRRCLPAAAADSGNVVVLASLEIPLDAVIAASEVAAERGWTLIVNPAPFQAMPYDLIRRVDVLTPNEIEAAALIGRDAWSDDQASIDKLLDTGAKAVLVTLGAAGALVLTEKTRTRISAPPVAAVDATGAGDVFNGALAAELAFASCLHDAARVGVTAASIATTAHGASTAPRRAQVLDSLGSDSTSCSDCRPVE